MTTDWFKELEELNEFMKDTEDQESTLAKEDPEGWLQEQLEKDSSQCYTRIDARTYRAASVKNSTYIKTEVKLDDEGFLVIKSSADILPTEENVAEHRLFQMYENATFRTAGYAPAQVGEPITFEVRIRPDNKLDVSNLMKMCLLSLSAHMDKFKSIQNGRSAVDICSASHKSKIETAFSLFGH